MSCVNVNDGNSLVVREGWLELQNPYHKIDLPKWRLCWMASTPFRSKQPMMKNLNTVKI